MKGEIVDRNGRPLLPSPKRTPLTVEQQAQVMALINTQPEQNINEPLQIAPMFPVTSEDTVHAHGDPSDPNMHMKLYDLHDEMNKAPEPAGISVVAIDENQSAPGGLVRISAAEKMLLDTFRSDDPEEEDQLCGLALRTVRAYNWPEHEIEAVALYRKEKLTGIATVSNPLVKKIRHNLAVLLQEQMQAQYMVEAIPETDLLKVKRKGSTYAWMLHSQRARAGKQRRAAKRKAHAQKMEKRRRKQSRR